MKHSIWAATIDDFSSDLAKPQPSPAAGSAAAVSARLAVCLLIKVLEITSGRKRVTGDTEQIHSLLQAARNESETLGRVADEDSTAFAGYLASVRQKADQSTLNAAMLEAIEVPMNGARSAARALALCGEAVPLIPAFIAADLGAAALLLSGAVRAMLITVDYNLRHLTAGGGGLAEERIQLEAQSGTYTEAIVRQVHLR